MKSMIQLKSGEVRSKADITIFIYYIALLVVYVMMSKPGAEYGIAVRLVFFAAILLPALRSMAYFLFSLVCFYSMTYIAFTPILPTSLFYYLPVVLIFYFINHKNADYNLLSMPLLIYFLLIDIVNFGFEMFPLCFLIVILITSIVKNERHLDYYAIALMVSTIVLSYLYYVNMDTFAWAYGNTHDQERYGWINPNEYSGAIGCGGVIALQYLFGDTHKKKKWIRIISYLTIVTSSVVIVINASRGTVISFGIVAMMFVLFSKIHKGYKILGAFLIAGLVIYILTSDVSALLLQRLQEDSMATGTGRLVIWSSKLSNFFDNANFLELLFGVGRAATTEIPPVITTHNDFVTALIGYGLFGAIITIIVLLYPLFIVNKQCRLAVALLSLFLIMECFVLEPLFRGYFTFVAFYFYIYRLANINKKQKANQRVV